MINLIPPEGAKVLKREYLLRVGATCSFLGGGVLLVFATTLVPTYILTQAQVEEYQTRLVGVGDEAQTFADVKKEVEETQVLLAQLQTSTPSPRVSDILREINRITPEGITFKTFGMQSGKDTAKIIQVQGTATTRETLIQFKNFVEKSEVFEKVEIPISDLANDANLPFAASISFATST